MLREATEGDLGFVHELFMDESVNPFLIYDPMPVEEFAPVYKQLLGEGRFLVFEEDGVRLGTGKVVRGTHRMRHTAYLGLFAIAAGVQNQGVGTRMMTEILELLRGEGAVRIELSVSADNPRGIAFYEKLGFTREGTMVRFFSRAGREGYFDEHMMACFLDSS